MSKLWIKFEASGNFGMINVKQPFHFLFEIFVWPWRIFPSKVSPLSDPERDIQLSHKKFPAPSKRIKDYSIN